MSGADDVSRPVQYQSYLIRVWREQTQPHWRASLRSIQTGQEHHFAHLEQLFVFLHAQTSASTDEES